MISPRLYVIVPRTLYDAKGNNITMSCGRMAAQAAHIMGELLSEFNLTPKSVASTDLIILQVANSEELYEVRSRLETSSVDFVEYNDTNKSHEGELTTALALYPIERGSCAALRDLKPWICACNI